MTRLRAAILADLPILVGLDQAIFGGYGADEDPAVIRARLEIFPAGCVVIEEDGRILGYLTTEQWEARREPALDEDPRATHCPNGGVLNITTLAVDPAAQGRGLGRRLLTEAIEIARRQRCREIILETARAREFYTRHGFDLIGEREQRGIRLYVMGYQLGHDPAP